jgi:lipoyl(octanoyl) transferase
MHNEPFVRWLGVQDYQSCWDAMRNFTKLRCEETPDEIWLLEHPPVFTQGQNGKPEHILAAGDIPIIRADRGGQVTYHGPGQLVVYALFNIQRKKWNVRQLITLLEESVITLLSHYRLPAIAKRDAPGIYVQQKKIGSVGLRIRKGYSYHGLALNVSMDLAPFSRINPCGFSGLQMTQLREWGIELSVKECGEELSRLLLQKLQSQPYST